MKINLFVLASLLGFAGAFGGTTGHAIEIARPIPPILFPPREIACADALKPYLSWASGATAGPEDVRWIGFMSVYNQNRNGAGEGVDTKQNLVGYSSGGLKYNGGNLVGDATSYFSDRTFCSNPVPGGLCASSAPFNPNATDIAGITIQPDGKVITVLKSWGNSTYTDNLICLNNGIFYVPSKAGQKYMTVITLTKAGYRSPR
jgi:hypothetical protein